MGPLDPQWHKLLDIVEDDTEMRTGQYVDGPKGKARLSEKWNRSAADINELGPAKKNGQQWKEAYYGLRSRSRQAHADQVAYMRGTGGGEPPEVADVIPNGVYARCLGLCGTVSAIGNRNVQSSLRVQEQQRAPSASSSANQQRQIPPHTVEPKEPTSGCIRVHHILAPLNEPVVRIGSLRSRKSGR